MHPGDRLRALEALPPLVARALARLSTGDLRRRPRAGGFASVEHAWHLADQEVEAFAVRIERLLAEDGPAAARLRRGPGGPGPALPDRATRRGGWPPGPRRAPPTWRGWPPWCEADWLRAGRHETLGPLTLADLPGQMLKHDRFHAGELASLLEEIAPGHPEVVPLREHAAGARPGGWRAA